MISLALSRGVHPLFEQPMGSIHLNIDFIKSLFEGAGLVKYLTYGGAFGMDSVKRWQFWSTHSPDLMTKFVVRTLQECKQRMGTQQKKLFHETSKSKDKTIAKSKSKKGWWSERAWVNGNHKALTASAAYPSELCDAIKEVVVQSLARYT